jgi:4-amino-4-deoxy-L-arabinose transferase-like glycosyltransferase
MLARMPLPQMLAATSADVHPPTWYAIEMVFVRLFGVTELVLRLPALIFGVLAVCLTYKLARSIFPDKPIIPLLAAGLMAVNPFAVYYSQEARMYALLMFSVLLATLGAVTRRPMLLALGCGLTLLSHNMAFIYVPVILLLAWMQRNLAPQENSAKPAMITSLARTAGIVALGALPWMAWLPTLYHQATTGQFESAYWISYFTRDPLAKLLAEITALWFPHFRPLWTARVGALVAFALIVFPVVAAIRTRSGRALLMTALAFAPGIFVLAISIAWQPVILARTLAGALPAWCILISWWIAQPRRWDTLRAAMTAVAAMLVLATTASVYSYQRQEELEPVIAYLNKNGDAGQTICHSSGSAKAVFEFYSLLNNVGIDDVDPSQCDWLLYERYITTSGDVAARAETIISTRHGTLTLPIISTPVFVSNLYKLQ